ncbi:signal transduction histidine kinase [Parvibaculum lavamentivorans DS-1]|uniref:histidine kinase n=1 Tax=Parvibaculum lavamentivorans (strain DS-1 / DSM 13023 / NCIMB 13966) TaxID=402881 RepID=A7HUQ5_PARL1|nr:CHASE3 domain-containing protein [Parvibaculum lavamentivorans]ABS63638.1 signal transduction histidine kinase [Parvibaculum lavamentivorans DS-1]
MTGLGLSMRVFGARDADTDDMRRVNAALMTLAFLLLFGASAAALMLADRARTNAEAVSQTIEVRADLLTILNLLQGTETGQRGFLLTRDSKYLEPYNETRFEIGEKLTALEARVADNPGQQKRIEALHDTVRQRIAILDGTIAMAREGDFEGASKIVGNDRGKALMDESRRLVDEAISEENALLAARQESATRSHTWLFTALVGALVASFILAFLALQLTRRQFMNMKTRRDQLLRLNEELERRVAERTADLERARELAESEAGRAEYERGRVELLLRDVTHRVGNNLAMVSSLLRMQQSKVNDGEARSALETARGRIQTISTAQRRLRLGADLQSTRADELLEAVVSDLADSTLENGTLTIVSDFQPLIVASRDTTTLAVVLGELVSNAIKHAFQGRSSGEIKASFTLGPDGIPLLAVIDDGIGMEAATSGKPEHPGLGTTIIDNLSRQYGGEIKRHTNEAGGTSIFITLPKLQVKHPDPVSEPQNSISETKGTEQ